MCGRVKMEGDFSELKVKFRIPDDYPTPNYAPSWNVAPTDQLPIVRYHPKDQHRTAQELVRSFTIITTTPNELCGGIHNRMPVILPPEAWPVWLGEEKADAARLKALLAPYPAEGMTMWRVSQRVGNVKNNDPTLIAPISLQ
jgi:putative SOS response-associated peptidase YedK